MPHAKDGREIRVGSLVLAPYAGCKPESFPKFVGIVENIQAGATSCNANAIPLAKVLAPGTVIPISANESYCFTCGDAELIV